VADRAHDAAHPESEPGVHVVAVASVSSSVFVQHARSDHANNHDACDQIASGHQSTQGGLRCPSNRPPLDGIAAIRAIYGRIAYGQRIGASCAAIIEPGRHWPRTL
jgi:hypothetical protein